jgi:four helix bundle protein
MKSLKSYRELTVWSKSMNLVEAIYKQTRLFPREEIYGLTSQLRRAAVAIPSNIAEGQSRNTSGEFVQFLGISRGSLAELETQLELAARLGYLPADFLDGLLQQCTEIGKMINALIRSLRRKSDH